MDREENRAEDALEVQVQVRAEPLAHGAGSAGHKDREHVPVLMLVQA